MKLKETTDAEVKPSSILATSKKLVCLTSWLEFLGRRVLDVKATLHRIIWHKLTERNLQIQLLYRLIVSARGVRRVRVPWWLRKEGPAQSIQLQMLLEGKREEGWGGGCFKFHDAKCSKTLLKMSFKLMSFFGSLHAPPTVPFSKTHTFVK